jgi:hypothetical protein
MLKLRYFDREVETMRTFPTTSAVALMLAGGVPVNAGPVLLASYDEVFAGGTAPQSIAEVQFVLQLSPDVPLAIEELSGLGAGIWWEEGDQGAIDFTRDTSAAFPDFAAAATDGIDSRFASLTGFFEGNDHGVIAPESTLFGRSPDLVGYELELVRLIVREVRFEPLIIDAFEGFSVESDISYQFYGSPIPEPSAVILLAGGVLVLARGRRVAPYSQSRRS